MVTEVPGFLAGRLPSEPPAEADRGALGASRREVRGQLTNHAARLRRSFIEADPQERVGSDNLACNDSLALLTHAALVGIFNHRERESALPDLNGVLRAEADNGVRCARLRLDDRFRLTRNGGNQSSKGDRQDPQTRHASPFSSPASNLERQTARAGSHWSGSGTIWPKGACAAPNRMRPSGQFPEDSAAFA